MNSEKVVDCCCCGKQVELVACSCEQHTLCMDCKRKVDCHSPFERNNTPTPTTNTTPIPVD